VGRAAPSGDGSVTFTPAEQFFGTALLTYTVQDETKDAERQVTGTIRFTVFGRPSKPPAPSGTAESHLVRLTWGVPANNGAPITGYVVESDTGGAKAQAGTNSATIDGLKNAQPYRFRVAALNKAAPDAGKVSADQWSDWSPTLTPDQFPDQPAAPVVEFRKDENAGGAGGVLHVRWSAPKVDGTPITEYKVQPSGGAARSFPPGTTSVPWTGLNNGTPYTFTVVAINKAGDSEPSPPSAQETPAGVPGQTQGVSAVRLPADKNADGGWALVNWGDANANGDPQGLRYSVTSAPAKTPPQGATKTDAHSLEWNLGDVNTAFSFTVIASNKAGDGAAATSTSVVAAGQPRAPAAPRFLPGDGVVQLFGVQTADARGPGTITYQWSASQNGSFSTLTGSAPRFDFGLSNTSSTTVWVRGCKGEGIGCGAASQAVNSSTGASTVTPFGPPSVTASHSGTTIEWNWNAQPGVSSHNIVGQSGGTRCSETCYRKSFNLGERHCIQVVAVGQGVQQPSSEKCEPTDAPPPRTVSLTPGDKGNWPDCSTSPCRRLRVEWSNFSGGAHTVECWGSYQGWSRYYTYTTASNPSEVCYFGYPGSQVYVVVDGVQSNTITWPAG
jgi:hypothetical protein